MNVTLTQKWPALMLQIHEMIRLSKVGQFKAKEYENYLNVNERCFNASNP